MVETDLLPPGSWRTPFPSSSEPIFGGVQLSLRQMRGLQIAAGSAGLLAGIAVRVVLGLHGFAPGYSIPGADVHDRDADHGSDRHGLGQAERLLHDLRLLAKIGEARTEATDVAEVTFGPEAMLTVIGITTLTVFANVLQKYMYPHGGTPYNG